MRRERHRADSVGQAELARRVIGRVGADDDQRFDTAGVNVAGQIAQRFRVPDRDRIDRRDEIDRRIELLIDPMTQRVHFGRLSRSGQNHGGAELRQQIGRGRSGELCQIGRQCGLRPSGAKRAGNRQRDIADEMMGQCQAVIGQRAA